MKYFEDERNELKATFIKDIKKEIIAFANTLGGKLYIGISDNGEVIGVENTDTLIIDITNMLRDSISPDIMGNIKIKAIEENNKDIILIEVAKGINKPYYLNSKGIKTSGVFVRQGSSSVPASESAIRNMIKMTDGYSYEKAESLEQTLTFRTVKNEFEIRNIPFGEGQMKTLGFISEENYTNLALLLSEECLHSIKVAKFKGKTKMEFEDRKEFKGSILGQLEDAYTYISLFNKKSSKIEGLRRIDTDDYPDAAIREALINSIVHRDYSYSGSILVSIFEDRIEVLSIGGLIEGLKIEDIKLGASQSRNEKLASVFYRLELVEAYGTGISKIFESYKEYKVKPKITLTNNVFLITLPNIKHFKNEGKIIDKKSMAIDYIKENGYVTRRDIEEILNSGQTTAGKILKELMKERLIIKEGAGPNTVYRADDKR
ncbi:MAG: putative DNA binding domain-containing protein [Clostridia bacterium]|nr:putative DNA binding domain-containing protein [Clostridia bacterium]